MKRLLMAAMIAGVLAACQGPAESEKFCFDEMTYSPSQTVFKLFAPAEAQVRVVVGTDSVVMTPTDERIDGGAVWTATVEGDLKGRDYVFVVDGQASPGVFAKAVTVNGQRGVVVDMADTNPEGWVDDCGPRPERQADWVVYEMHHRDFSIARNVNLHPEDPIKVKRASSDFPGKFLALTEPWALGHLQQLGVTAVHLLPSYDFGSVDETRLDSPQYNWGYDPVNYNVPDGSYSTDPTDPLCRIREFKQMVQALHQAGIAVVLDVVYNHTYDIEHSNFQRTFPDYYYRKTGDGAYSNGSGCGNETASERTMMRRFMVESVKHWIREYHIDGLRFDLMGVHDIETMNAIREAVSQIDPTILIYGEGWSAGACALPTEQLGLKANVAQMPGIAAFSDDLRDALRGPFSDDTEGAFLTGDGDAAVNLMSLKAGVAGMVEHPQVDYSQVNYSRQPWAAEPTQMMAYASCHDDMCLVDRLLASHFGGRQLEQLTADELDELIRLDLLAQTAVFTSQGIPFMLSGEELLRTKQLVHNSFESPDSINQLDWSAPYRYPQVLQYYQRLIALHRHHPAFRLGQAELVRRHLTFLDTPDADGQLLAFRLTDAPDEPWKNIVVVLNASPLAQTVDLPGDAAWTVVCRDGIIDEQGLGTAEGGAVTVSPQTALIIHD